jgi:geranylgeranyl diphosphate synthase type I
MVRDPAERVEARLAGLLAAERARWTAVDPDAADLLDALERLVLAPAKRLRPAFCYWGFVAAGGDPADDRPVSAGAAFELLHAFALLHDDVMDGSWLRRGQPACHVDQAARHDAGGWAGESRRFGDGVAILAGDLAYAYADELMRPAPDAARAVWTELRLELNVGQYLDILGTARRERRAAVAERIARYKSGRYTVERPLHVGALLAEPPEPSGLLTGLSGFGVPLGDAFQFRDDLLGAFGDPELTGKPVGDDLREGKPTVLLAMAAARADPVQREILAAVGDPELSPADVAAVQEVLVATGAVAELETRIDVLVAEALDGLAAAPIAGNARPALTELTRVVAYRSR